jgi:hypothetical protein
LIDSCNAEKNTLHINGGEGEEVIGARESGETKSEKKKKKKKKKTSKSEKKMILLALLFGAAQGAGEIDIQNQPTGVLWCGQNFVLNFTYPSNVAAGTEFKVQLMYDAFDVRVVGSQIGNNKEIVNFGTVKAPETLFSVLLPSPFPAEWLGDKKLDNEGLQQKVLFRISKVTDDKFNSDCSGTFCRDTVFGMNCCPADNAAKCGCDSCSCANNDVCGTNLECDYTKPRGVCQVPLPGLGENCPNNKCSQPYICQCPMGTSCLASDKTCNDNTCAKPAMGTPGRLNCPCSPDSLCESGTLVPALLLPCLQRHSDRFAHLRAVARRQGQGRLHAAQGRLGAASLLVPEPKVHHLRAGQSSLCLQVARMSQSRGHLRRRPLLSAHRLPRLPVHSARVVVQRARNYLHLKHVQTRRNEPAHNHATHDSEHDDESAVGCRKSGSGSGSCHCGKHDDNDLKESKERFCLKKKKRI